MADVDLSDLQTNRLNGTTIPLYDKRKDVRQPGGCGQSRLSNVRHNLTTDCTRARRSFLVERGLAASRSQAQRLIASGARWLTPAGWRPLDKADDVPPGAEVELLDTAETR